MGQGQDRDLQRERARREAGDPVGPGTPGKTALTDLIPTARTGRPMRTLDRRDRAPGRVTNTVGLSRAGQAARDAAAPSPGEAIADLTGDHAELAEISLSFELPSGLVLLRDFVATAETVQTSTPTQGTVTVTADQLLVQFHAPLLLDISWPSNNLLLKSVRYHFDTAALAIDLEVDESMFAFGDPRGRAQATITERFRKMIAGTVIGRPGYDPFVDRDIMKTLDELVGRFKALAQPAPSPTPVSAAGRGTGYGTSPPPPPTELSLSKIGQLGAGVKVNITQELTRSEGGQGVRLAAGSSVALDVRADNAADRIASGASVQAGLESAKVRSVHARAAPPLEILFDGKPVILLEDVTIYPGGHVEVGTFSLSGALAKASGWEALFRTVGAVMKLQSRAGEAPPRDPISAVVAERMMLADAMQQMAPHTVSDATREGIASRLTSVVRALIAEHGNVIPGIDLRPILG